MTRRRFPEITFTESVRAAQSHYGTRASAQRLADSPFDDGRLSEREREFIAARDSFYVASVLENGWPYLQHRGGPAGFLKVIDARTIAFADYKGNGQLQTTGTVAHDDRVALFLMDYPDRRRLKLLARATVHDADEAPELARTVHDRGYQAKVERVFVLTVEAFDWNCPQHITPRYSGAELAALGVEIGSS